MGNRFEDAGKRAAQQTNEALSAEISSVTGFDADRLGKLFPTPASRESLQHLIGIVKASTDHNEQVAKFKERVDSCADVALTLVKAYMKII